MTTPYYSDDFVTLYGGDCLQVMAAMPDASVDAVVTDPPYGLGFMGREWDDLPPGLPWARECLRALKPGGHMLAFGGTRTWHRLACAVEDAGFEIRDSIAWLYGSGFPKSLDVSKAIDKAAGAQRPTYARAAFGGAFSDDGGTTYGTAIDGEPITAAARAWQGWGTALKPAFEPIVVGRKPLVSPGVNVLARVESELKARGLEGEIRWTTRSASDATRLDPQTSSSSTEARPTGGTSAAHADASETQSGAKPTGRSSATPTAHGAKPTANTSAPTPDARQQNSAPKSSPPMATPAPAVGSERPTSSLSTTSTEAAPLTARRSGERSTTRSNASDSQTVIESFAGIATGLTGSWATARIDRLADGTCVWPDGLPRSTAGGSTVAANVLAHGTGALNIDATRVTSDDNLVRPSIARHDNDVLGKGLGAGVQDNPAGRWPANVILDESQAAALDEQSGVSKSVVRKPTGKDTRGIANGTDGRNMVMRVEDTAERGQDDEGGASRFFPTFRYEAKAPSSERPRVDGIAHPTVKPLDLMRWLVRLVTPPGGTVLEPFAGSGTTAEACVLEGFHCIAIEREPDYLPLIVSRLSRPMQLGLDFELEEHAQDARPLEAS